MKNHYKTSAATGYVSGMNTSNGWFNKCHVEVHILNYISLPLCTILMQHRSCFSNRCALYRVSAEGFRLQLVLGAGMSIRNLEIWLIHHGTLTFQYFEMEYLIFVYVSRIMHADVLVMVPSVHLIITLSVCLFFSVYTEKMQRKTFQ